MTVLFDEATHTYYEDLPRGRRTIPSVTQILCPDNPFYDQYGRERGDKIHSACRLWLKGTLDENKLDPVIVPYLEGLKNFFQMTGAKAIEYEQIVYHANPEYAGRFDLIAQLDGEYLIDFKSGSPESWHKHQVALYAAAKWGGDWISKRLGVLYLKADTKLHFMWKPVDFGLQIRSGYDAMIQVNNFHKKRVEEFVA